MESMNDLNIALLSCSHLTERVEEEYTRIYQVQNLKDLVRLLIEKPVDLVILPQHFNALDKLGKIFVSYKVPFIYVHSGKNSQQYVEDYLHPIEKEEQILSTIQKLRPQIAQLRVQRENDKLKFLTEKMVHFSDRVTHTGKDLFISEVKSYFNRSFKMESCHWVEVKAGSSKLPPILKLKQELEKLKIDQGALIADLEKCSLEIVKEENFQIWKNSQGDYLVMVWLAHEDHLSQCLILNKVKIRNQKNFKELMQNLHSFLQRRWNICLQVGETLKQVYRDSLTDLYNQRFLTETLAKKIEEYKRYNTPFSVLFIDVDHFKRVNDSLGHLIGSGVLKELGDLLKRQIRNSDYAFRYGGDEFIILLSHTEGQDAVNVAERIRREVENFPFKQQGIQVRITVSIGLAFYPKHAQSAEEIIRIADEAMYYGKNKSRNIVYKAS